MKKIIYFGHDVEIGNMIEIKGLRCEITQQLVDDNPSYFKVEDKPMYFKCVKGEGEYNKGRIYKQVNSTGYPKIINPISEKGYDLAIYDWQSDYIKESRKCFELTTKAEWDMQEILDKAKRDYPIGTRINSRYGVQKVLSDKPFEGKATAGTVQINTDQFPAGITMYTPQDGWCEIIPFKFTTEDGVDIYGDMKTYMVYSDLSMSNKNTNNEGTNSTIKYFYHKKNALAYIEKHKEKTLVDYENILSERGSSIIVSSGVMYSSVYGWLKYNEPKLYYSKILQLIADDLNGGWEPNFTNYDENWYLNRKRVDFFYTVNPQGVVCFKSKELAEKARDIMGDKVKYLIN